MTSSHQTLLSEVLRPNSFDDLFLPAKDVARLKRMVTTGLQNMLFYGPPGRGKTSAARIFKGLMDVEFKELNGSAVASDRAVEKQITDFAMSTTVLLQPKVLLIDEADALPKKVQQSMRHIIEGTSDRCRFILTVNDFSRIIEPLHSRLFAVNFGSRMTTADDDINRLQETLARKLDGMGFEFDRMQLHKIISINYPDLRAIMNKIEYEFG